MLYSFEHQEVKTTRVTSTPDHEPTDEVLMSRIQAEDEQALSMMYHRHLPLLRTIISRVINNDADADDLVQEVFLEVWRRAAHYSEEKGKALGWLVTLARRRAIDKLRKKQAYQRAEERLQHETEHDTTRASHDAVEEGAAASDRAEIFQRVLGTLPEAQREAVTYAFYRGMSQREIAAHTGIPLGTIKTRLELAVRKLRSAILANGGEREWSQVAG